MGDISEFKRGQIVSAYLAGSSVTRTASLCGVWSAMVSRVMLVYHNKGPESHSTGVSVNSIGSCLKGMY